MIGQNTENLRKIEEYIRTYSIIIRILPDSDPGQIARSHTYAGLKETLDSARLIPSEFLEAKTPNEKVAFERNFSILEDAVSILEREKSKK